MRIRNIWGVLTMIKRVKMYPKCRSTQHDHVKTELFDDYLDRMEQYTRICSNLISIHKYWEEFEVNECDEQEQEDIAPRLETAYMSRRQCEMMIERTHNASFNIAEQITCYEAECE